MIFKILPMNNELATLLSSTCNTTPPPDCLPNRENRTICQIQAYKTCPKFIRAGTNSIAREVGCKSIPCRPNGEFYPTVCEGDVCYCRDVREGSVDREAGGRRNSFYCNKDGKPVSSWVNVGGLLDFVAEDVDRAVVT